MVSVSEAAKVGKVRYIAEPVRTDVTEAAISSSQASVTVAVQAHSFSGPMPLPEHLAQYDRIVPGAGRLIVDEFQMNSPHTREIETMNLRGSIRKDMRAQFIAGFLVLIGFGLIYGLADRNHDGVAISVAVTLLVSVLTAFLTGTVMRGKVDSGIQEAPGD